MILIQVIPSLFLAQKLSSANLQLSDAQGRFEVAQNDFLNARAELEALDQRIAKLADERHELLETTGKLNHKVQELLDDLKDEEKGRDQDAADFERRMEALEDKYRRALEEKDQVGGELMRLFAMSPVIA